MIELCREKGLATAEMQLKYAKENENTLLPKSILSREVTISLYEKGIKQYKDELIENQD